MIPLVRSFERLALSFLIIMVGLLAVEAASPGYRLSNLESWVLALFAGGYLFAGAIADVMEHGDD